MSITVPENATGLRLCKMIGDKLHMGTHNERTTQMLLPMPALKP